MMKIFNYKIELFLIYFSYFVPMLHFLLNAGREIHFFYKATILILALVIFIILLKGVLFNDYVILRGFFGGHAFCLSLPIAIYYFSIEQKEGFLYDISMVLWLFVVNIIFFRAVLDARKREEKSQ